MQLAWVTDIHLDFLTAEQTDRFFAEIVETGADGVVVTGDIALATTIVGLLRQMGGAVKRPVWFVLGNHDFYGGSIATVRAGGQATVTVNRLTGRKAPAHISYIVRRERKYRGREKFPLSQASQISPRVIDRSYRYHKTRKYVRRKYQQ